MRARFRAGFKKDAVEILQDAAVSKISSRLVEAGYDKDKAESYGKAMQKGGALVVAEADNDKPDEALSTMRSFKALTPEALLEKLGNQTSTETETAQVIEDLTLMWALHRLDYTRVELTPPKKRYLLR